MNKFKQLPPNLIFGAPMVALVVIIGLISFIWTPYSLTDVGYGGRLSGPGSEFWLGTDRLGRDIFSQMMAGARAAIIVGFFSILVAAILGVTVGIIAASSSKLLDKLAGSAIDLLIAFPTLLLAMLIVTVRGPSFSSAILAIGIAGAAVIARVTRVNAQKVMQEDYFQAAIISGTSRFKIVLKHILPNIAPTLLMQLMLLASGAILTEASLSYLGLGAPPPNASWGRLLLEAQQTVLSQPIAAIAPGIAIAWTALGLNLLGDGLREYLDPTIRGAK